MAKKNTYKVNFVLPTDEGVTEYLQTKTKRINKVFSQINSALINKYNLGIGDLKSINVYKL